MVETESLVATSGVAATSVVGETGGLPETADFVMNMPLSETLLLYNGGSKLR